MIALPFEILLPVGALAFYLYDCLLPLYGNELLLVAGVGGWRVRQAGHWVVGGRRLFLLDPLQPQAPTFRVALDAASLLAPRGAVQDPQPMIMALCVHRVLCLLLGTTILIALPLVSLALGAGLALLGVFALAYGITLVAGVLLVCWRARLGLSLRKALGFAFDGLLCPPFGVNLVRKLTLQASLGDAVQFMRQVPDIAVRNAFREGCRGILVADLPTDEPVPPDTAQALALLEDEESWR